MKKAHVIGGGLAGSEAAWQLLNLGFNVELHEMRPKKSTEAHKTGHLAELVCSNSLKSMDHSSAPGLLKKEMKGLNSLIIESAYLSQVPAGNALAVDREVFSNEISKKLLSFENFRLNKQEVTEIPSQKDLELMNEVYVIATGPLTSSSLSKEIQKLCDRQESLYFYDAIAPILCAESIDFEHCFYGNRYENSDVQEGDYINIPLDKEEYYQLIKDIEEAQKVPLHEFEKTTYFESCLPIEVMVERGPETLRFGPLKPVGFIDPRTGKRPYAIIQLRAENNYKSMFSMVGFQTKMTWGEQKRIFCKIKALQNVEFFRMGSVHRNTYIQSPKVLNRNLSFVTNDRVFIAGQITGVEGYTESAAIGLLAGRFAGQKLAPEKYYFQGPPSNSIIGALYDYITLPKNEKFNYSPMNANLGLLEPISKQRGVGKMERKSMQCARSSEHFVQYLRQIRESDVRI